MTIGIQGEAFTKLATISLIVFIAEIDPSMPRLMRTVAVHERGAASPGFTFELRNSPSERVLEKGVAGGAFSPEDQSRAQRTLETAKRRADEQRKNADEQLKQLREMKPKELVETRLERLMSHGKFKEASER